VKRTLLLVVPFAPVAGARHGGGRVAFGLVRELAARHDVVLLHFEPGTPVDPEIEHRCTAVAALAPRAPGRRRDAAALVRGRSLWGESVGIDRLARAVAALSARWAPDVVQIEYGAFGEALAAVPAGAARIVTIHDPAALRRESVPLRREGLALTHHLDARVSLRQERRVLGLADAAVVFTEGDKALLERHAPQAHVATIPFGWDVPATALDPAGKDRDLVVFVANFAHPPNVDAALALATRILPRVRERHPAARLELVGASPPAEVRALASDAVRVTGPVAAVEPFLDRAAVVVAPLRIGGGMRAKVVEALAAGKAVVASRRAAAGLAGDAMLVVDGEGATADAVAGLVADEAARRRLGERARAWALETLSWRATADAYDRLYARCAATMRS
jgi:glycosyltransferase involved in cell wall biosynthesis